MVIPIPFARLQDDEAIYYVKTRELTDGFKVPVHRGSTVVPFLLWAPALLLKDGILSMRAVTALTALSTAILVYFIALKLFDPQSALTSSLLYLFFFQVLRFGTRAMLDPFGAFFAILSLCLLIYGRPALSGVSFSLAAYSYQFWIPMYPLYLLQAVRRRLSLKRFLSASLLAASTLQTLIFAQHGLKVLGSFMEVGGPSYVFSAPTWLSHSSLMGILQGWLEFSVFAFIPLLGLAVGLRSNPAKWLLSFAALQSLFVSLCPDFALYGGATHYPYGLCPLLALAGGHGLPTAWRALKKGALKKEGGKVYPAILLTILLMQLLLFNHSATALSLRAKGIYDVGYEYDVEAIEALREMDKGGLIIGQTTHGLLIDKDRFIWRGSLELNPQVFMAYKTDVAFKEPPPKTLRIVEVGPYIIIGAPEGEKISDYVSFSPGQLWAFRSSPVNANPLLTVVAATLSSALILTLLLGLRINPSENKPFTKSRRESTRLRVDESPSN